MNEAVKAFENAINVLNDMNQSGTFDKISGLDKNAFMSLMGTMVDSYGAANNMSSEDILEMMDTLVSTMKQVHADLGGM